MTDSRDKPELETLSSEPQKKYCLKCGLELGGCSCQKGWGTMRNDPKQPASVPPAPMGFNSVVIKPETRVNKTEDAGQRLEQPKVKTVKELAEDFCNCPPDQPNQNLMIISEIEGLLSQVNERLEKLPIHAPQLYAARGQAIEEIDLFQKTTLFDLRKAFE